MANELINEIPAVEFVKKYELTISITYNIVESLTANRAIWDCTFKCHSRQLSVRIGAKNEFPSLANFIYRVSKYVDVDSLEEFLKNNDGWLEDGTVNEEVVNEWKVRRNYKIRFEKLLGIEGVNEFKKLHKLMEN